jgi:hypothetical protein
MTLSGKVDLLVRDILAQIARRGDRLRVSGIEAIARHTYFAH